MLNCINTFVSPKMEEVLKAKDVNCLYLLKSHMFLNYTKYICFCQINQLTHCLITSLSDPSVAHQGLTPFVTRTTAAQVLQSV